MYLDTSVFFNAYFPTDESDKAEDILNLLSPSLQGITSEWMIVEMFRVINKQKNLENIDEELAQTISAFFLADIEQLQVENKLRLLPVQKSYIMQTERLIATYNLYAADAVHLATAMHASSQFFISFDSDFNRISELKVINPLYDSVADLSDIT